MIIPHLVLVKMRNVSDNIYRDNQNTICTSNKLFSENHVLYDNMEKYCRVIQATDENVGLIRRAL
jgi:hypothetical protein